MVGIGAPCMQWSKCMLFKLTATSKDSSRCMIEGIYENEYNVQSDIGDMIT